MKPLLKILYKVYRFKIWLTRPLTIGVRVIMIRERSVLLVKHSYEPHWFIPGGGVKRGETMEQAARREAREEAGAQLGKLNLMGVYTNLQEYKSDHVTVFYCTDFTLAKESYDFEIEAVEFFDVDNLPEEISAGSARRVKEYLNGEIVIAGDW
jgi:8-oxo-dGTP pyrophosphatase MutT (NUDIX family)